MKRIQKILFGFVMFGFAACSQEEAPSPQATADFTLSKSAVTAGQTVSFNNRSTNATAWEWTFEGGTPATSSEQNPTVTYNTFGTYKVTLKASNNSNSASKVMETAVTVLPSNMVVYFPFDGNADDFLGKYNYLENEHTLFVNGKNGKAKSAIDVNQGLTYKDFDPKVSTEVTIAAWIKPDVKMDASTNRNVITVMGWGMVQAYYANGYITFEIYTTNGAGSRGVTFHSVQTELQANTWYHVAVVIKKGETGKVYLNGTASNTNVVNENIQPDVKDLDMGALYSPDFDGAMDDYMFFNRALSASEIDFIKSLPK